MLWVDKHRPTRLASLSTNAPLTSRLTSLSSTPTTLPHLLFYGPPGSGKKTRISCLLSALFGKELKLRLDKRVFTTPTGRNVEINLITSNYHVEMCPGDCGLNDRYVVQDVIKEMASSKNIVAFNRDSTAANNTGGEGQRPIYKVVVLHEVDKLTRPAQAALRRTMEKYSSSCRLILCCNNPSRVIDPVRSRCLGIRVGAPGVDEVRMCFCCNDLFVYDLTVL
jgi:replication factor C subunit 3/5